MFCVQVIFQAKQLGSEKKQNINFKTRDLLSPWKGRRFNIIISDVSNITGEVTFSSP